MKEDYLARGFQKIHDDLAFLMNCFREVLEELGEQHLADNLPWINQVRIDPTPNPRLCQAYSIAFQFLNMVEENVAAQVRRARESETGLAGEPGLWADQLRKLRQSGISESTIAAQLNKIRVEPVLTAHPTEAKRLAVLEQHRALYGFDGSTRKPDVDTPGARGYPRRDQSDPGTALADRRSAPDQTGRSRRTAERCLLFAGSLPKRLERCRPAAQTSLDRFRVSCRYTGFPRTLPRIRFGTWVGGDRDGHPLVTAEVTRETFWELRRATLQVLHNAVGAISLKLTMTRHEQKASDELGEGIARLADELSSDSILQARPEEPWRQFSILIQRKIA